MKKQTMAPTERILSVRQAILDGFWTVRWPVRYLVPLYRAVPFRALEGVNCFYDTLGPRFALLVVW